MTNLARSACWSRDDSGTVMSYAWYFHVSGKSSIYILFYSPLGKLTDRAIYFTFRFFQKQEAFEKCWAHLPLRAVLHYHSPGVATVARRHCRTLPADRCPQRRRRRPRQQRERVTEGTAMAPWNGPNKKERNGR